MEGLINRIREIENFPKDGITFKDITTLLSDAEAFQKAVDMLSYRYFNKKIDKIVGIEARGFIVGAALAYKLCKGVVLVRKKGKLPYKTIQATYELEYGTDILELHIDAVKPNENILIVDDLLATGGTVKATVELIERLNGNVLECCFLCELEFLKGREKLKDYEVFSLLKF
jgi:adenine phosphoribosyltransferase